MSSVLKALALLIGAAIMICAFAFMFVWVLGFFCVILAFGFVAHCFGARIVIKSNGVKVGYFKFFRYYPIRKF